jgi:hypothetical protein
VPKWCHSVEGTRCSGLEKFSCVSILSSLPLACAKDPKGQGQLDWSCTLARGDRGVIRVPSPALASLDPKGTLTALSLLLWASLCRVMSTSSAPRVARCRVMGTAMND